MRKYELSSDGTPDLIVKLDASHVEAFVIANRSAMGLSEELNTVHESLGLLKSSGNFQAGRYDNMAAIIKNPVSVEDFGAELRLPREIVLVKAFRNQCAGHLPAAMLNTMAALGSTALTLVFHKGGPVFVIHPQEKDGLYRLASIRFEGARDVAEERSCVSMNQASRIAYHDMWELIAEKQGGPEPPPTPEEEPHTKDLIDNPTASTPPAAPRSANPFGGDTGGDQDEAEDDATEHRSAFGVKKQADPEHDENDIDAFVMDDIDGMQF
ncbi:hypothetical protein [Erythrobacter aureus]|uniref:Uncharacterized protein n=1 Tax=Erythrobacter aureus TaxID=2182384 RepID=A0A345YJK1_9SPHN|nr:hypothetical protein [Erythrobacter aureus]AXK44103.1 hypothetical protein DVR09_16760 [Erythrobacter aureus]